MLAKPRHIIAEKPNILYVDDEQENLTNFSYLFRANYNIHVALSAEEGLAIVDQSPIKVVISDQRMPGISGVEFLEKISFDHPDIMRILVTGYSDLETVINAINRGEIYRYVAKPWEENELYSTIESAIDVYDLRAENQNLMDELQEVNKELRKNSLKLQQENIEKSRLIEQIQANEQERLHLQKQLQQAQKMESLGQLTGGVAHNFNNILAIIIGYTGLALHKSNEIADEKLSTYLEQVHSASERAKEIIQQMLTFSRADRERDIRIVQLGLIVEEVAAMLRQILPSSIIISIDKEPNIPPVKAEPVQVQQILMNLCINSRDAMNDKGRIDISLQNKLIKDKSCTSCGKKIQDEYVELVVRDNGCGIDPQVVERMFEPFFTTKEIGKGTGMGLSLVHGIVHDYKGHIFVESIAGKGTAFHLFFPRAEDKT